METCRPDLGEISWKHMIGGPGLIERGRVSFTRRIREYHKLVVLALILAVYPFRTFSVVSLVWNTFVPAPSL